MFFSIATFINASSTLRTYLTSLKRNLSVHVRKTQNADFYERFHQKAKSQEFSNAVRFTAFKNTNQVGALCHKKDNHEKEACKSGRAKEPDGRTQEYASGRQQKNQNQLVLQDTKQA